MHQPHHAGSLAHSDQSPDIILPLVLSADAWANIPDMSEWVLNIVKRGYSLQFARRPPRFRAKVETIVKDEVAHLLCAEIAKLLRKGAVETVPTALHWAVKQGRVETVDMMLRSGADVNQRAGYTPLHLASLHGHGKIIQLLINNYNAKVNIRDYHGKMAAHYWTGSKDLFTEHRSHSAGSLSRGRRVQCYTQLSALLSRSHSNRNINAEASGRQLEPTPLNRGRSWAFRSNNSLTEEVVIASACSTVVVFSSIYSTLVVISPV
ncbi:unnamed protein product [Leuciscus chuanchicus]